MKRILALALVLLLTGCGGGGGTGSAVPLAATAPTGNPSSNGNGGLPTPGATLSPVGNATCLSCHTSLPDNSVTLTQPSDNNPSSPTFFANFGLGIGDAYHQGVHSTGAGAGADIVQCEFCHGDGSQHFGVGPIPHYAPSVAECSQCHSGDVDPVAFNLSGHGNGNPFSSTNHNGTGPDQFFFQGGFGSAQATLLGQPAWLADGVTPVTQNQAIEECSACHSSDQKLAHVSTGDVFNPPQVACNSCHDAHQPADAVSNQLSTRPVTADNPNGVPPSQVLNFKPQMVNNNVTNPLLNQGGPQFGAKNLIGGTWVRPTMHFPFHVGGNSGNTFAGYLAQGQVPAGQDSTLRLSPERLCASCHTQGTYQFTAFAGPPGALKPASLTHNDDVFTQYNLSLHASRSDTPMTHFSMVGGATTWPVDMGSMVLPAESGGKTNGNFACMQCHNGIASIDYTNAVFGGLPNTPATNASGLVQPTPSTTSAGIAANLSIPLPPVPIGDTDKAHIVWGDCSITCITCHDPHQNSTGPDGIATTDNVRVPRLMSFNTSFHPVNSPNGLGNQRGGEAAFMDLSPLPPTTNSTICLLCHQGRESGLTLWNRIRLNRIGQGDSATAAANFFTASANTKINASAGFSFDNPHYLPSGALLFSVNEYEFPGNTYSKGIPQHQATNCTGCHMDTFNPNGPGGAVGGHTFNPQITTCLTSSCHGNPNLISGVTQPTITGFHDIASDGDWAGLKAAGTPGYPSGTSANALTQTVFNEIGILVPITQSITPGQAFGTTQTTTVTVTDQGNGQTATFTVPVGGTGLMGLLNQALFDAGIFYNPNGAGGTYFFKATSPTTKFTAFTPNTIGACFDLADIFKTGGTNGEQAAYVHNPHYTAQILIDCLAALGKTTNPYTGASLAAGRPVDSGSLSRPAINYVTQGNLVK